MLYYEMIYLSRWDFGDNTASVSHPVSAPLRMEDSHLHQSAKHFYLQDSIHHTFSFPGTVNNFDCALLHWHQSLKPFFT